MIRKELLSEVLGVKSVFRVMEYADNTGMNVQAKEFGRWQKLNIYELAHNKCIDWILSKGYSIHLLLRDNGLYTLTLKYGIDYDYEKEFNAKKNTLKLETREDLIFKACEWISEQGKQDGKM